MYSSYEEIDYHLERLSIEREIAYQKLIIVKEDYKDDLKPLGWMKSGLKLAGKYGIFVLLKKLIK